MSKTRVPGTYPKFDGYIKSTNTFLQSDDPLNPGHKQFERLGLTLPEATDWKTRESTWSLDLFPKHQDDNLRTLTVRRQCQQFKKDFALFARPLLSRMAASPDATEQDETVFNFKITRKDPTRKTNPITAELFAAVSRVGSAEYEIGCRADAASKRPSLAEGTDSVIISTKIVAVQPADPATIDPEGDGFIQKVLTKAKFVYKAGTSNKGKYLIVAFRWNYTKAPDLAGPWTEAQVILIS